MVETEPVGINSLVEKTAVAVVLKSFVLEHPFDERTTHRVGKIAVPDPPGGHDTGPEKGMSVANVPEPRGVESPQRAFVLELVAVAIMVDVQERGWVHEANALCKLYEGIAGEFGGLEGLAELIGLVGVLDPRIGTVELSRRRANSDFLIGRVQPLSEELESCRILVGQNEFARPGLLGVSLRGTSKVAGKLCKEIPVKSPYAGLAVEANQDVYALICNDGPSEFARVR